MTSSEPILFSDQVAAHPRGGLVEPQPLSSYTQDEQRILLTLLDAKRSQTADKATADAATSSLRLAA